MAQLKRGILELAILKLLRREPSYGYALIGRLAHLGPLAAGENTIYPLLRRLRKEGALETYAEESPAGPPRQHYRLTHDGEILLAALEREWSVVVESVSQISEGTEQ